MEKKNPSVNEQRQIRQGFGSTPSNSKSEESSADQARKNRSSVISSNDGESLDRPGFVDAESFIGADIDNELMGRGGDEGSEYRPAKGSDGVMPAPLEKGSPEVADPTPAKLKGRGFRTGGRN